MSVIIHGLNMPGTCGLCPLCLDDSRIVNGYCMVFKRRVNMMERDKNCPLVPLPEGHGRLIDADKLTPDMGYFITGGSGTVGSMCSLPAYSQQNIDNAPTIVPAEGGKADEKPV